MSVDLKPVVSSSLSAVGYDEGAKELHVRFKSGKVYVYKHVPAFTYRNMLRAPSIGKFHAAHVKDVYPFTAAR